VCNSEPVICASFVESHPGYELLGLNISDDTDEAKDGILVARHVGGGDAAT
jgi:hypothetical protein